MLLVCRCLKSLVRGHVLAAALICGACLPMTGCGPSAEKSAPLADPSAKAAPTDPTSGSADVATSTLTAAEQADASSLAPSELRKRLGLSDQQAQFERVGGRIAGISLVDSGLTTLDGLRGIVPRFLEIRNARVSDLTPLASRKLERLILIDTDIADLAPFAGSPLETLGLDRCPIRDLRPVTSGALKQVELLNLPLEDLSPLSAAHLEYLWIERTQVRDLSPLKDSRLAKLHIKDSPVADLSPLSGRAFEELDLSGTAVVDLEPVSSMRLGILWLRGTKVVDLSPLATTELVSLDVQGTPVSNLQPLAALSTLQRLNIADTQVTDLTPLATMTLTRLIFTPGRIAKGLDVVRGMPSLQELDVQFEPDSRQAYSPSEFWRRYDAGEFKADESP